MNGIIETATGELLRWGYTDFVAASGETQAPAPLPGDPKRKYQKGETQLHRWSGSSWELVAQPAKPPPDDTFGIVYAERVEISPSGEVVGGSLDLTDDAEIQGQAKGMIQKDETGARRRLKLKSDGTVTSEVV